MSLLLNWRLWVALAFTGALAFSHFTIYRKGRADVQLAWDASKATANAEARQLEQRRQDRADEAASLAAGRGAAIRSDADRARRSVDGMRSTLDATERRAKESADAAARLVSTYRTVFESCLAEYRALGEEAAGHASDSLMYQQSWPR